MSRRAPAGGQTHPVASRPYPRINIREREIQRIELKEPRVVEGTVISPHCWKMSYTIAVAVSLLNHVLAREQVMSLLHLQVYARAMSLSVLVVLGLRN